MHKEAELNQLVTTNKLGKSVHVYKLHDLAELILTRWNGQIKWNSSSTTNALHVIGKL